MSTHALFSPSSAERWLKCGYSIKMKPFYPSTDTAASLNGTKHHGIAGIHLENGTDSRIPGINVYLNAVRNTVIEGGSELLVERKVIIAKDLCEGTLDAGVIAPDWFHIFDLKWGKSPVHATDNPQLMLYALGIVREYQLGKGTPCTLSIAQPNATSGFPLKHWNTDVDRLLKFYEKVQRAFDEGLKENPKAVAGSHCYWCPAKINCEAYLINAGKKHRG
jgi:hypothetical protein